MLEIGSKTQTPDILKLLSSYSLYFVFTFLFYTSCKINLTDASTDMRFIRKSLIIPKEYLWIGVLYILGCQDKLIKWLLCNYLVTMANSG